MTTATQAANQGANITIQDSASDIATNSFSVKDLRPSKMLVSLEVGGKIRHVPYEKLFSIGHKFWNNRRYEQAIHVFKLLNRTHDRGPRASIMLAHSYAMEFQFAESCRTLYEAFGESEYRDCASRLHDIFVMWACTFYKFVRADLEKFVGDYPELPTPALLLGDFYLFARHYDKSIDRFRQAIQRDFKGGSVGRIANHQIKMALAKTQKQTGS